MPKKNDPAVPKEFPKTTDMPEVSPDSIPDTEPLPAEPPVQIPKEVPTPDIPDEQPEIPDNIKGLDADQAPDQ